MTAIERLLLETKLHLDHAHLLQAAFLRPAEDIPKELLTDKQTLDKLFLLGETICRIGKFDALAYTQIPKELFAAAGISADFTNCIFLSSTIPYNLKSSLLLNPTVERFPHLPKAALIEGCGSIDYNQTKMVILRPLKVEVSGHWYRPQSGLHHLRECPTADLAAMAIDHEYDHLLGKTALDRPEDSIDFTKYRPKDWLAVDTIYRRTGVTMADTIEHMVRCGKRRWLIPQNGSLVYYLFPATT